MYIRKIWKFLNLILTILRILIIRKWSYFITVCQFNIVYLRVFFIYNIIFCFHLICVIFLFILNRIYLLVILLKCLIVFNIFLFVLHIVFKYLIFLFSKIRYITRKTLKILLWIIFIFLFFRFFLAILVFITASLFYTWLI